MSTTANTQRMLKTASAASSEEMMQKLKAAHQQDLEVSKLRLQIEKQQKKERDAQEAELQSRELRQVTLVNRVQGYVFNGGLLEGKYQGVGVLTYRDGSTLEANFVNGIGQGPAVKRVPDVSVTKFNFVDGEIHGVQEITTKGGVEYTTFEHGVQVGCQRIVFSNGDVFLRNFKNGQLDENDKGLYKCSDGTEYIGMKPASTKIMWKTVGKAWGWIGSWTRSMNTSSAIGDLIMAPVALAGTAILGSIALTATAIGAVVSPVTATIDVARRSRNVRATLHVK